MRRSSFLISGLFVAAGLATAQTLPPIVRPFAELTRYLELTVNQYSEILRNNNEYNRMSIEKQRRIAQVQGEIAEERRRDPIDPGALGARLAEIEVNCRELKDAALRTREKNLAVMTDAQRTKLRALEQARRLIPIINQADQAGLLGAPSDAPQWYTSDQFNFIGAALAGFSTIGACTTPPVVIPVIREPFPISSQP